MLIVWCGCGVVWSSNPIHHAATQASQPAMASCHIQTSRVEVTHRPVHDVMPGAALHTTSLFTDRLMTQYLMYLPTYLPTTYSYILRYLYSGRQVGRYTDIQGPSPVRSNNQRACDAMRCDAKRCSCLLPSVFRDRLVSDTKAHACSISILTLARRLSPASPGGA